MNVGDTPPEIGIASPPPAGSDVVGEGLAVAIEAIDGRVRTTPFTGSSNVGGRHVVTALPGQTIAGSRDVFSSGSDGSPAAAGFTTPEIPTSLTASDRPD